MKIQRKTRFTLKALRACKSVNGVAALLRKCGITGWPSDPYSCPLANGLKQATRREVAVSLTADYMDGGEIPLPDVAFEFVKQFDSGKFPRLKAV